MSGPPTNNSSYLDAFIINAADNKNLDSKLTITQVEVKLDCYREHIESALSKTSKLSSTLSNKDTPRDKIMTLMRLSRIQNYHICDIIHHIYKDTLFSTKIEIKFISIADPSFVQ